MLARLLADVRGRLRLKQRIRDAERETALFEDEFSREYARLLGDLEHGLFVTDDPAEQEELKAGFLLAVAALMRRLLRRHGHAAAVAGWRSDTLGEAYQGMMIPIETNWESAVATGLIPRLQQALQYMAEGRLQDRLAAVGAYGMLFGGLVWSAFWAAHVTSGDPEILYRWNGMGDEMTCATCSSRIGNIYRASRLPGWPGDRSTDCNGFCRCWLEELSYWEALHAEEIF